jgi:hypothetical protein
VAALARLYRLVIAFRRRMNRMRDQAPYVCQQALLDADPVMRRYVAQPAMEFVREHGLEDLTEIYCGPLFQSTLFVPVARANAFYYLANLFPILLPIYAVDIRPAVRRLTAGFADDIVMAKATRVEEVDRGRAFEVVADARRFHARYLVMAVPCRNADELLSTDCHVRDIPYCTIHVRGLRKRRYLPGKTVFLREHHAVRVLWPQRNGEDIAFGDTVKPDLSRYYEDYEITNACAWKTAIQLAGRRWRPLQPRANLFTVGDHNICGLEDSYLTGLFAANRIIGVRS